jgi:hypothetical protein
MAGEVGPRQAVDCTAEAYGLRLKYSLRARFLALKIAL